MIFPQAPRFARSVFIAALAFAALAADRAPAQDAASPKLAPEPWAHEGSDLKPDPKAQWGSLDNGFRYVLLPNPEPPNRVSLRLYVASGSLMESDDQQGLAHFLEHLAFNGTENFPAGEMIEYFQRLGMAFGSHTNAHTSFDETVYKLELPKADKAMIDEGLKLFRDYADKMLMAEKEIDKERGVILAEKRDRDSADFRTFVEGLKFSLPDARITKRLPIGTEEVIKNAPREQFTSFYQDWYTCDRMVLAAVGAVDPAVIEPMIKEYFGSMVPPKERRAWPDMGTIEEGRGLVAKLHTEMEASNVTIDIERLKPWRERKDTKAEREKSLAAALAGHMLSRRFEILAKEEGAPFIGASAYVQSFLQFVDSAGIQVQCKPEQWAGALAVAEKELRRALLYGFTKAEFEEAKAKILNSYEEQARTAETRQSRGLADALVSSLGSNDVFTSPAAELDLAQEALGKLTPEACLEEFRGWWKGDDLNIFVGGNVKIESAPGAILEVWKKSGGEMVEPPEEAGGAEFAYQSFGDPGKVAEKKTVEDLGITQVRFANNVRLNIKPTDFEKNVIRLNARVGGGMLTAPAAQPGLPIIASATFDAGGLEKHSADELERMFAGKTVGVSFSVGEDAFEFGGRTSPDDLADELRLLAAYISAPGYREEGLRQFRRGIGVIYQQLKHSEMGVFQNEVTHFIHGSDPRFGFPAQDALEARTMDEVKAWLTPQLSGGYLEIGIVGDVDVDKAIELAAATLGALPGRAAEKAKPPKEASTLAFPDAPQSKVFPYESEIPKAMAAVFWKSDDIWDIKQTRRLNLLTSVFGDRLRLKVREELGEAYSPMAHNVPTEAFDGFGYLFALITVTPEQADSVAKVVTGIAEDLKTGGVTADELDRALQPMLSMLEQLRRDNGYWLRNVTAASQEQPQRLDWARTIEDDIAAITADDLSKLAAEFLGKDKAVTAIVKPE
ncbi:MAG: insulinase family protein [Verrucomicrobiales bacterium]